ncbi:hypothetical protein BDD12DRAFT_680543, partial [Trichophaea hybrida]
MTSATGPTLLPTSVASIISLLSKSTSVSIRLGTLVGATLLDTARTGTLASLEVSRAAVEGIVRRGSHGVVARGGREAAELEGWASKGMTAFNTSISLTELIISTAFELGQTTLSSISGIVETSVLTLDSIFGSTETSRAINEIVKLVREEFKDSSEHDGEVGIKDIVAGLTCFAILQYRTRAHLEEEYTIVYETVTRNPGPYYPTAFHLLHNLRKYIRFAAASYGARFMRFLLGSQFLPLPTAEREHHLEHLAFSFHTSLPVDTILLSSHYDPSGGFDSAGHTGTGRPLVHFVCVDHEAAAIVVTCRGTLGLEDALIDLTCEYTSVTLRGHSYRVHKGMYNSATLLLRSRLLHNLATALAAYPSYGLVLTGHSLGGGVAALVSILISTPHQNGAFTTFHPALPQDRPIHCYAFGSPAIVCEPLRKATRGLVTTVVNGNDVVPSLSIGVVRDFHSVALSFREDTDGVLGEVRRRFLRGVFCASTTGKSEEEWNWEVAVLKTLRAGMRAEKLVPPGEVWRVVREGGRVRAWVVEDVQGRFGEVRFGRGCFGDHSPGAYEEALEGL